MTPLAQKMAQSIRGFVERSTALLARRIDELDARIKEIPAGAKGDPGESIKGDPGEKGDKGDPGKDAEPIHPDTIALMVRDAVEKAIAALPPAKDGEPGRDATQIIPLPGIDETRSYPAGTYAQYNGGEIRAVRKTDPIKDGDLFAAGWTVAREGIAALVITQGDDPRNVSVAAMLTGGTKTIAEFYVPMVIDKGVWREGEYEVGDGVTVDGSFWIAQRKTTDRPGTSDGFRLSVKKGRDGRDAPNSEPQRKPVALR